MSSLSLPSSLLESAANALVLCDRVHVAIGWSGGTCCGACVGTTVHSAGYSCARGAGGWGGGCQLFVLCTPGGGWGTPGSVRGTPGGGSTMSCHVVL